MLELHQFPSQCFEYHGVYPMKIDEDSQIPLELVDADEWEAIEQAFAATASHFGRDGAIGVDLVVSGTQIETPASSLTAAREYELVDVLEAAPCIGSVACKTDAGASEETRSAILSKDQLNVLHTNFESEDVRSETLLEEPNKVRDHEPKRPRRILPAWSQKNVTEEIRQVQALESQMRMGADQTVVKPILVQTNLKQLTDPWLARPACKAKLQSKTLHLQFKGRLVYSKTHSEVDAALHDIWEMINAKRSISSGNVAVGFDLEWKASFVRGVANGKAAVMQLCLDSSRCDVLHIAHSGIPPALVTLLEDPCVLKTGVGTHGDASKLRIDYGIQTRGVVDLSEMANKNYLRGWQYLKQWSLSSLAQELTCKKVDKVPHIRCGNWEEKPLSEPQLQYAATDAFVSLYLYQILESFPNHVLKNEESCNDSTLMQQASCEL